MKKFQRNARPLRAPPNLPLRPSPVAGVQGRTSQHVRPRELILGQLLIFGSIFTRPTNHPRHAASGVSRRSKPVRPPLCCGLNMPRGPRSVKFERNDKRSPSRMMSCRREPHGQSSFLPPSFIFDETACLRVMTRHSNRPTIWDL